MQSEFEIEIEADLDLMINGAVFAEQVRCTVFVTSDLNDEMEVTAVWIDSVSGACVTAKIDRYNPMHKLFFDAAQNDDWVQSEFAEELLEARYEGAA
jgi:hypothetical protein